MSQPASNCQILLYRRSTFAARRCDSIIFAIRLYMMPLGSRSPIYFNLSNCRGEPNFRDRILPLFSHRFLEFASFKTDGCWVLCRKHLAKKSNPCIRSKCWEGDRQYLTGDKTLIKFTQRGLSKKYQQSHHLLSNYSDKINIPQGGEKQS